MVAGYHENKYKGFNNFKDAVEWLSDAGHDTFHFCQGPVDGPKTKINEHSGHPECYVVHNGRWAAIFESYRYSCLQSLESVSELTRNKHKRSKGTCRWGQECYPEIIRRP